MSCDYLDRGGYLFSNGWICKLTDKYISSEIVRGLCDTSNYRDCEKYIEEFGTSGTCYLTTAMCEVLGKEDNCKELETLRSFRENYLKETGTYDTLLTDYAIVGPIISEKILDDENCENVAKTMKKCYIDNAIYFIENEDYRNAVGIYIDMTLSLMDYYELDTNILRTETYGKDPETIRIRRPYNY